MASKKGEQNSRKTDKLKTVVPLNRRRCQMRRFFWDCGVMETRDMIRNQDRGSNPFKPINVKLIGDVTQSGRVVALQVTGRRFKSCHLHFFI